jgi:putative transposase
MSALRYLGKYGYGSLFHMRIRSNCHVPAILTVVGSTVFKDTLTCACGFEGHADLTASETFLKRYETVARPMARPVCLKWDSHDWLESPRSPRPNEEHTNPQVASVVVRDDEVVS